MFIIASGAAFDQEVMRMARQRPGRFNGKPVTAIYYLPVTFRPPD